MRVFRRQAHGLGRPSCRHHNPGDGQDRDRPDVNRPGDGLAPGGIQGWLSNGCRRYNTATKFNIKAIDEDGLEIAVRHDTDHGILFEGTEGRIFVNRGKLVGKPVEDLAANPLPADALKEVYKQRELTDHVANCFDAVAACQGPISDVYSQHRALTTCHLAGIAAHLGRKIQWNPNEERIIGDTLAQSLVACEKRAAFTIEMQSSRGTRLVLARRRGFSAGGWVPSWDSRAGSVTLGALEWHGAWFASSYFRCRKRQLH